MADAYLVTIHRFLGQKKEEAKAGLKAARTEGERAYYQGMLDEQALMKAFVSDKYDMAFRDYGEVV